MAVAVLPSRSHVPAATERHVLRPRLTRLLDGATGQAVVLVAPAGYGKTTLAAEWLRAKPRVAWFRATPTAADVAACSTALAEAVDSLVPGAGERLPARLRVAEAPEEAARPLAELLAEDLAEWPKDAWLAVDDYHVLSASAAVEQFFDWLLTLAPSIRIVVTSRQRPSWVTARRVLYGEITELGPDDLAMTDDEVAAVVAGPPDAVGAVIRRARGWPAVVALAALSTSRSLPKARVADALYRYFADEVLRSEPPAVRRFMLDAAVPPSVDVRVASNVLGLADAAAAIARLRDEGLLQEAGGALAFHPLLREFLLAKLEADDVARRAALYERSIGDAQSRGAHAEAFELALEAGLASRAVDVAEAAVDELLDAGRIETVERWLARCGDAVRDRPALALAQAEVSIRRGRLVEASILSDGVARALPDGDARTSAAWYLAGRSFHLLSEDERALACHLRASEAATGVRDRVNALWGATVLAAQLENDAIDRLVGEMEALAAEDLDASLQLASARTFLGSRRGSLAGIWSSIEPLTRSDVRARDPMALNSFLIAASYLCISRADYRRARELSTRAVASCSDFRLGRLKTAFSLCYRVAAEIGLRRFADAERALEEIESLAVEQTRVIVAELRILRAKLELSRGNAEAVLEGYDAEGADGAPLASAGEYAALVAIAAAAAGDTRWSRAEARRARQTSSSIESRFYSRAAGAIARGSGAPQLLKDAARVELLDAVVLAYRAHPPLLSTLAADAAARPVVTKLVNAADDRALARRAGIEFERGQDGRGLLTPREQEVLELLSKGLANGEIARRLFISEKTAKVHVYHIFEKLGVRSRVQAVLAAQELETLAR